MCKSHLFCMNWPVDTYICICILKSVFMLIRKLHRGVRGLYLIIVRPSQKMLILRWARYGIPLTTQDPPVISISSQREPKNQEKKKIARIEEAPIRMRWWRWYHPPPSTYVHQSAGFDCRRLILTKKKTIVSFDGYFLTTTVHINMINHLPRGITVVNPYTTNVWQLLGVGAPMIILAMNGCQGRLSSRWKYVYGRQH